MPTRSGGSAVRRRLNHLTIDLHCHVLVPAVEELLAGRPEKAAEPGIMCKTMGEASVAHNNAVMLPMAGPKLTRIEQRLADMEAIGVDVQVISPSPNQYYYWAEPELALEIVRLQNEHIAALCAEHPKRLAGLGTVALQHPQLACEQLEHAVKALGLKGVEISTSVNGRELSDPALAPFWAKAGELGALVFIHPFGSTLSERTSTHYLVNTIGQPLETTIALSHLIFHGVLDAHPGLRIIAAHGGGYLPTYIGRSDHAFKVRPEAALQTKKAPSEHIKRIWFDTVLYDSMALRHLVDRVGASQVVVGTDYPFDMGQYSVHALVEQTPGLDEDDMAAILGGNAAALIGWLA
ncbi:amidohydrolase family protein [Azohydromonas australica]|uniref:amidohydrolase family protein n=1 Tax=Azohydromonas australica TaxID=364039 RepID=UPI00048E223B|nr:amidohydrolase family protein [Azohydromonas australica]